MDAQSDAQAYNEQMTHGIQTPHNITPNDFDIYQKPYSYGPDITWVIAAGPFDVAPGEKVIFTFADFVGINESDLIRNAKLFQSLYNNNCSTPKPPDQPLVQVIEDDSQVTVFWDDRSEASVDPVTLNNAFQGYRVYRSHDRGLSWGNVVTDLNGDPTDVYQPLAIYDISDGITGSFAMSDPLIYYNLGTDGGLQYSYVDDNVVNGYEYWYAVSAYDGPDDWAGSVVDPLENSRSKNAYASDVDNTIAAIPQKEAAGYDAGSFSVTHSGESDATLDVATAVPSTLEFLGLEVTPDDFTSKGHTYAVTFSDTVLYDITEVTGDSSYTTIDTIESNYWMVFDQTDNVTVVAMDTSDISSGILTHVIDGFVPLFANASWRVSSYTTAETTTDADTSTAIVFGGLNPGSNDGTFAGFLENLPVNQPEGRPAVTELQRDLEFRFGESSIACYFNSTLTTVDTIDIPFSLWSTEENKQLGCLIYQAAGSKPIIEPTDDDPLVYEFTKTVYIMPIYEDYNADITHLQSFDYAADAGLFGWMMYFNKSSTLFESGNVFKVTFQNPLLPGADVFTITTVADDYKLSSKDDLENILVVPNPYKATSAYESVAFERELQFHNLPEKCVIRIYNTAGEMVQILKHDESSDGWRGPSIEAWNLQTYNIQEIAFGVYIFHVISDENEFVSKFAVIK
jgi:hypothetical protein